MTDEGKYYGNPAAEGFAAVKRDIRYGPAYEKYLRAIPKGKAGLQVRELILQVLNDDGFASYVSEIGLYWTVSKNGQLKRIGKRSK